MSFNDILKYFKNEWPWLSLLFIISILATILILGVLKRLFLIFIKRDTTGIQLNKSYTGRIVRVGDGDGIRVVVYRNGINDAFFNKLDDMREIRKLQSYPIRLYGVDAPESPCFGNPGQPYAKESKQCLIDECFDKKLSKRVRESISLRMGRKIKHHTRRSGVKQGGVNQKNVKRNGAKQNGVNQRRTAKQKNVKQNVVQKNVNQRHALKQSARNENVQKEIKLFKKCIFTPLAIDQYSRYVSVVLVDNVDLSFHLLKKGYATVYTGKGACHYGNRQRMERMEQISRRNKRGMWAEQVELPAEYKKRMRKTVPMK